MKVTVFHTTNCAFCKTEMQWLDSKNIEYSHYNIDEDPQAMESMIQMNLSGVPITIIDKNMDRFVVRGFDRQKLSLILGV